MKFTCTALSALVVGGLTLAASGASAFQSPEYDSSSTCFFDVFALKQSTFMLKGPNDLTRARPADIRIIRTYKDGKPVFDTEVTVTEIKKAVLFDRQAAAVCITPKPGQIVPADGCISAPGYNQEWVIKITLNSTRQDTPVGLYPPPGGPSYNTTRTVICTSNLVPSLRGGL